MLVRYLKFIVLLVLTSITAAPAVATATKSDSAPTVYFYAWGGSESVNSYLNWVSEEVAERYGIQLQHVKVADISEAVTLLLSENNESDSKIDLLWINGENFKALKAAEKLLSGLPEKVAHSRLLRNDLNWRDDFGEAVDGQELPWGIAQFQLVFRAHVLAQKAPPVALEPSELLQLAMRYPGRFSYPKPPAFHGTSWLKALAYELVREPRELQKPPGLVNSEQVLQPLWHYLDQLHPYLWRSGKEFPGSAAQQRQWFNHGTLDNAVTFNPNEVPALQQQLRMTPAARAASLGSRALTNFHYLAIPRSSGQQQAALKVLNFLLSEPAQLRKSALDGWGDPMVINAPQGAAETDNGTLFPSHEEPHGDWTTVLEQQWLQRYQQ